MNTLNPFENQTITRYFQILGEWNIWHFALCSNLDCRCYLRVHGSSVQWSQKRFALCGVKSSAAWSPFQHGLSFTSFPFHPKEFTDHVIDIEDTTAANSYHTYHCGFFLAIISDIPILSIEWHMDRAQILLDSSFVWPLVWEQRSSDPALSLSLKTFLQLFTRPRLTSALSHWSVKCSKCTSILPSGLSSHSMSSSLHS